MNSRILHLHHSQRVGFFVLLLRYTKWAGLVSLGLGSCVKFHFHKPQGRYPWHQWQSSYVQPRPLYSLVVREDRRRLLQLLRRKVSINSCINNIIYRCRVLVQPYPQMVAMGWMAGKRGGTTQLSMYLLISRDDPSPAHAPHHTWTPIAHKPGSTRRNSRRKVRRSSSLNIFTLL